jgi:hypothetical protein
MAAAAFAAEAWVIAATAAVIGLWLSTLAGRALIVRRVRGD